MALSRPAEELLEVVSADRRSHVFQEGVPAILGGGDCDGADRSRPKDTVGDALPVKPAVLGLPDASARSAEIINKGMAGDPGNGRRPAAAHWA